MQFSCGATAKHMQLCVVNIGYACCCSSLLLRHVPFGRHNIWLESQGGWYDPVREAHIALNCTFGPSGDWHNGYSSMNLSGHFQSMQNKNSAGNGVIIID